MAITMGLHLVPLCNERADEIRKRLRYLSLDEEGALDAAVVEHHQDSVDVAHDSIGDRRVVVEARLIPVLDVHRERVPWQFRISRRHEQNFFYFQYAGQSAPFQFRTGSVAGEGVVTER